MTTPQTLPEGSYRGLGVRPHGIYLYCSIKTSPSATKSIAAFSYNVGMDQIEIN